MRILIGLALGVVLAVDGHPLLGHHGGAEPGPEAEEMRQDRMEIHAAVRLAAVQVQRHREDRQLGDQDEIRQQGGPGSVNHAACEEVHQGIEHVWGPEEEAGKV